MKGAPRKGSMLLFHHPYPDNYPEVHWPRVGLIVRTSARRFTVLWGDTFTRSWYYVSSSDTDYMEVL